MEHDILQSLSDDDIVQLLNVLSHDLPQSSMIHNWIRVQMKWKSKISGMNLHVYCPNGDWTGGATIAFTTGILQEKIVGVVYCPYNGEKEEKFKNILINTELIPWHLFSHFHGIVEKNWSLMNGVVKSKKLTMSFKEPHCCMHYMPFCKAQQYILPNLLGASRSSRRCSSSYEGDGKTSVTILNQEADVGLMIDSYSQMGFRLNNGMMIIGPVALFPRSALSWDVAGHADVNPNSLELFFRLEPKLDLLVLGLGDKGNSPDPSLLLECRKRGLNLEILPTEQACATFNFLVAESRYVAAALIPPEFLNPTDDDIFQSNIRAGRLKASWFLDDK